MEWSNDIVISFIKDVEKLAMLWDSQNPFYKITRKKNDAWSELARTYNSTPEEVKKKWKSLQDSQQLLGEGDDEILGDGEDEERNDKTLKEATSKETGSKCDEEKSEMPLSTTTTKSTLKRPLFSKSSCAKRPKEDPRIDEVYSILKSTASERPVTRDDNDVFGEYVAKTLRTLDSHSRIVAKHYINQNLFDAEMGRFRQPLLHMQSQFQPQYSSSASAHSSTTVTPFPSPSLSLGNPNQNSQQQFSTNQSLPASNHQITPTPMQTAPLQHAEQVSAMSMGSTVHESNDRHTEESAAPSLLTFFTNFQ
ncbi:uncharacterized protein LOC116182869 isoform X2 [Photinus pyralis]|uniref:uncharacterized protein LOC116160396 isoform X2 n=1 Tax=Photinus pyralis TaxID=7054 RepID=UPI001267257F|nr:uncharacterized protein LOC116160396 isoform X2 [Photinus pyralis]XP_031359286.1 uncharacterized protein LOC116182869 isoform X2 [Photinus pyralis]